MSEGMNGMGHRLEIQSNHRCLAVQAAAALTGVDNQRHIVMAVRHNPQLHFTLDLSIFPRPGESARAFQHSLSTPWSPPLTKGDSREFETGGHPQTPGRDVSLHSQEQAQPCHPITRRTTVGASLKLAPTGYPQTSTGGNLDVFLPAPDRYVNPGTSRISPFREIRRDEGDSIASRWQWPWPPAPCYGRPVFQPPTA